MVLSNGNIRLEIDDRGMLTCLSLNGSNVIAKPVGLFRAVVHHNDNWEAVALAEEQTASVTAENDIITIRYDELKTRKEVLPIGVTLTIRLQDEKVWFDSSIENRTEADVVDDWIYPCLGAVETLEGKKPDLLYPRQLGERIVDVCAYLQKITNPESLYEISATYPGPMSMQWMMLTAGNTCLYLSGRDDLFHASALRAKGSKTGGVSLEMNKMAFVKPGETWKCPSYVAWLYNGSWMEGANEYRAWASNWRKPVTPKKWMQEMNGYFLVINKQQYGDELWPYDTLPHLYELAQKHGFDCLGLFGWYHTGHDNHYPDLDVSPTMGGAEELRKGIKAVQDKGGHVTLYFQGHLLDVGTKFYNEEGGREMAGKNRWGTPYYEYYDKFCHSDFLHYLSRKPFATVCPSCTEWHEKMAQRADWIRGFGADGILYDQIGGMPPYPCFDESHNHLENRPSLSHAQGRIALHKRIRQQVDQHKDYAYMTEHIVDVHSQFIDCLHGIGSSPDAMLNQSYQQCPSAAGILVMPDLFRYTFPETMVTIRNPKPYVARRFANYAALYGCKLEMELRYVTDIHFIEGDEDPAAREYVYKVSQLRRKFADYLLLGRYMAQEKLVNGNACVKASVYQNADGKRAVMLWNDTESQQPVNFTCEDAVLNAWASPDGEGDGVPATIGPEEILLIYQK